MLKKAVFNTLKVIFLSIFLILYLPINMIKLIFKAPKWWISVIDIAIIAGLVAVSYFFWPIGFYGVVILFYIISLVASIVLAFKEKNLFKQFGLSTPFYGEFEGMTEAEAKSKYRELMKIHHPDNSKTGSQRMATLLTKEYEGYIETLRNNTK